MTQHLSNLMCILQWYKANSFTISMKTSLLRERVREYCTIAMFLLDYLKSQLEKYSLKNFKIVALIRYIKNRE